MLRLIREHPIAGLVVALSLEAWLAVPGEAMIALAASAVAGEVMGWVRVAVGGLAGMVANDLALFGLSRIGRGVLVQWIGLHALHFHLSADLVLGAKFIPPLRSAAYMIYGLQGAPLSRFLWVSLLSSAMWVAAYTLLGRRCHGPIARLMDRAERGGRWLSWAEVGLTLAAIAAVWL
ncbi:MAG: DedA family protein [Terriglobales bacterium]